MVGRRRRGGIARIQRFASLSPEWQVVGECLPQTIAALPPPIVEVAELTREFGSRRAVAGVTFSLAAGEAIDGLLASPVSREAIFLGKAIANLIFVAAVQLIAIPALMILYNLPLGQIAAPLIAIALLAAIGLVAVGTLFSAMAVNTRQSETDERTPPEATDAQQRPYHIPFNRDMKQPLP